MLWCFRNLYPSPHVIQLDLIQIVAVSLKLANLVNCLYYFLVTYYSSCTIIYINCPPMKILHPSNLLSDHNQYIADVPNTTTRAFVSNLLLMKLCSQNYYSRVNAWLLFSLVRDSENPYLKKNPKNGEKIQNQKKTQIFKTQIFENMSLQRTPGLPMVWRMVGGNHIYFSLQIWLRRYTYYQQ